MLINKSALFYNRIAKTVKSKNPVEQRKILLALGPYVEARVRIAIRMQGRAKKDD